MQITPADEDYGLPSIEMNTEEFEREKALFLQTVTKTQEQIDELERSTVGQSDSVLWREERRIRLTASFFGRICKMKKSTHCSSLVKTMLYSTFTGNFATSWGKEHERIAKEEFEEKKSVKIEECGLFIDGEQNYLAATPDGLIGDEGIVEIKCPSSAANFSPKDAINNNKITFAFIDGSGNVKLKKNHNYFFQVQGQLHITKRSYCVFIIWTPLGLESDTVSYYCFALNSLNSVYVFPGIPRR